MSRHRLVSHLAACFLGALGTAGWFVAATTHEPPVHRPAVQDGGSFLPFYLQQLQHPQPDQACHPKSLQDLLIPCEGKP